MGTNDKTIAVFTLAIREVECLALFRLLTAGEQGFVVESLGKRTRGRERVAAKHRREGGAVSDSRIGKRGREGA